MIKYTQLPDRETSVIVAKIKKFGTYSKKKEMTVCMKSWEKKTK